MHLRPKVSPVSRVGRFGADDWFVKTKLNGFPLALLYTNMRSSSEVCSGTKTLCKCFVIGIAKKFVGETIASMPWVKRSRKSSKQLCDCVFHNCTTAD